MYSRARASRASNFSRSKGFLTFPHQMSASVSGSLTTNLSSGDRPVWGFVSQTRGPSAARYALPCFTASSANRAGSRFQYIVPASVLPCLSTPKLLTAGPSFFIPHLRN